MVDADLDRAAELTIWPRDTPARVAQGCAYPTLREALQAALDAGARADIQAWIITEAGDILSPSYIEAQRALPRKPHTVV